jgi:hypothetical protein
MKLPLLQQIQTLTPISSSTTALKQPNLSIVPLPDSVRMIKASF